MTANTPQHSAQGLTSGRFTSRRWILAGGLVVLLLAATALFFQHSRPPEPTAVAPSVPAPPPPKEIALGKKRTLQELLLSEGFAKEDAARLSRAMGAHLNLRRLKPEDIVQLHRDESGAVARLVYTQSPIDICEATRSDGDWTATRRDVPVERRIARVAGTLRDNLFESMEGLGERPQLVIDFAEIFAWDFDFAQDSQPGDQFRMLVEKVYTGQTFVRYGRILAAEYDNQGRLHTAVHFKNRDGSSYYAPSGESAIPAPSDPGATPEAAAASAPRSGPSPVPSPVAAAFPTAQKAPSTPAPRIETYVVQSKDTLFSVAKAHGVTVDDLVKANRLKDKNILRPGQKLTIPEPRR